MSSAGSLRSAGVTRPRRYYEPLRLPPPPPRGYVFPRVVVVGRPTGGTETGLSGSWMLYLRPPSSHTPRSPIAARARCFAIDAGFAFVGRLAAPTS
jgi:hypothetical protein